jgi:hypothetical protein
MADGAGGEAEQEVAVDEREADESDENGLEDQDRSEESDESGEDGLADQVELDESDESDAKAVVLKELKSGRNSEKLANALGLLTSLS